MNARSVCSNAYGTGVFYFMDLANVLTFDATVYSVTTLVDGGLRVAFDLPEDAINQAAALMKHKRSETALRVAVTDGRTSEAKAKGKNK